MRRRMAELVELLNRAGRAYYQESREIMSNFEYDALYDELLRLEGESGIVLTGSPTAQVGYEVLSELPREAHESPMLSLDKTKEVEALRAFLGNQKGLLSWKLDGLTLVLTYENGTLQKAVTRGNGRIGEVITSNARVFRNLPLTIPFGKRLVLRGEAVMTYESFERVNAGIAEVTARYKNPRNLCSGTVRQLSNQVTAERGVCFVAFRLVSAEGMSFENSHEREFAWLRELGFETVACRVVTEEELPAAVQAFSCEVEENEYPSDGLVLLLDDIAYGAALGATAKFPRDSIAFKWRDEEATTVLREVEWSPSRTGLINPVAVFDPVELEGTTVSRASVHNVSVLEALRLGYGDEITVYKANMIIPQIARNRTESATVQLPAYCPVCGGRTEIRQELDVRTLYCSNPDCQAKRVGSFAHFCSRDAMNIEGMSEATLEKLIDAGCVHSYAELFQLEKHRERIVALEGFGEKSLEKLEQAAERARTTTLPRLLYGLGIPGVGVAVAAQLSRSFDGELARLQSAETEELSGQEGIGPVLAGNIRTWFANEKNQEALALLLPELELHWEKREEASLPLDGLIFVITGSVVHFANRNACKAAIEAAGGKVTGSVTARTSYLINNDSGSTSSKNKTARALGVPVITEEELLGLLQGVTG